MQWWGRKNTWWWWGVERERKQRQDRLESRTERREMGGQNLQEGYDEEMRGREGKYTVVPDDFSGLL